jgi:CheY-like chemotaxis protein
MEPMNPDVLVADHDIKLARLYCRFLADHGLTAEAVSDGLQCLGVVRQSDPQVLVLDHELPWGDGEGVLACLREDGRSLPVILTTWRRSPEFARRMIVSPVVACLRKFFPLPTLLDTIQMATVT